MIPRVGNMPEGDFKASGHWYDYVESVKQRNLAVRSELDNPGMKLPGNPVGRTWHGFGLPSHFGMRSNAAVSSSSCSGDMHLQDTRLVLGIFFDDEGEVPAIFSARKYHCLDEIDHNAGRISTRFISSGLASAAGMEKYGSISPRRTTS